MYASTHACMYVYNACTAIADSSNLYHSLAQPVYVYMYACLYICLYICMHILWHSLCMYICMHVCTAMHSDLEVTLRLQDGQTCAFIASKNGQLDVVKFFFELENHLFSVETQVRSMYVYMHACLYTCMC